MTMSKFESSLLFAKPNFAPSMHVNYKNLVEYIFNPTPNAKVNPTYKAL